MPQTIECPNCKAPVVPDPRQPTIVCNYCGYYMKNTVYAPPTPTPRPPRPGLPPATRRHTWVFFAIPVALMVLGLGISLVLPGGSRPTPTPSPSTGPAPYPYTEKERVEAQAKLTPRRQLELKLAPYIECLDNTYRFILDNGRDRYLGWVKDRRAGPTCKERWVTHGVIAPAAAWTEGCVKQARQAGQMPPDLPTLEQAGSTYAGVAKQLGDLLKETSAYYEKKGYALDDCKKGQALHPRLMAGFAALVAARNALWPGLAARVKGALQRCMDRSQGVAGRQGSYHWARALKAAGDALIVMRAQTRIKQPDLQRVKQAIAGFSEALAAMEALSAEEKAEAGWSYHTHKRPMDQFQSAAVDFLKSDAGRRLGATNRYLMRVSGWKRRDIEGTFEKVVKHYQEIIEGTSEMKHCLRLPRCDVDECPEPR